LKTGLVSISFRQLEPSEVIQLCVDNAIEGIEWGGDVHVPAGNPVLAAEIRALTEQAGLKVAAYGSYYVVAKDGAKDVVAGSGAADAAAKRRHNFESVLESAVALGAPLIRVWAGSKGSDKTTDQDWHDVVEDSKRIGDLAAIRGVKIAYEYHQGTLTDTNESAVRLLNEVGHANVSSFWQPPNGAEVDDCCEGLDNLIRMNKLASVHAFHWWPGFKDRHPLAIGADRWQKYLGRVHSHELVECHELVESHDQTCDERYVCLEFVKDDDPENLVADAKTLNQLIADQTAA
jgi:3-dehydroshikimate dehydratase